MVCLQAQYLTEKHQLVNSLIGRKHVVSEAGPLSKGIEADSSCGRDEAGRGHLKLKKKEKERAESERRERRAAGVRRSETEDSPW